MMTPELAISNNVSLYGSIFRAHGLAGRLDEHYWSMDADPPPYYSRLVTRTRGSAAREAQLRRLAELSTLAAGRPWGFKDSFDELPSDALAALGLRPLFRAVWYGWDTGAGSEAQELEARVAIQRVTTSEALLVWEEAWRASSPSSTRVFPDEVLRDTTLEVFSVSFERRMVGGFLLNQSEAAVGLSNVFRVEGSRIDAAAFVRDCARTARRLHAGRAVIGFGSSDELESLASLGFGSLGPLAVWVSP